MTIAEPMADVTAVILAGGRGTRIQALHPETPKPMIPVLGQPFLHWLTAILSRQGIRSFVYSTGYRGEQIEAWCEDGSFPGHVRRTRREDRPLGTGGGLLNCLDLCAAWVLVANGDGLCLSGIPELLRLRGEEAIDGGLIGVHADDTSRFGSLDIDPDGLLTAFREKVPGTGYVNGGFYLFRTSLLRRIARPGPLSLEKDLISAMLAAGARLRPALFNEAPFIDIGLPETLAQAETFLTRHLASIIENDGRGEPRPHGRLSIHPGNSARDASSRNRG